MLYFIGIAISPITTGIEKFAVKRIFFEFEEKDE
jgi:hypothetical protein